MEKITSAYANKLLKSLEEDKKYWLKKEEDGSTYVATNSEEPVIPEYDYAEVAAKIEEIDEKIVNIKHALNVANAAVQIPVGDKVMSVDTILIRMAQKNRRRLVLDVMRKRPPKERNSGYYGRGNDPEYRYTNYDPALIRREYEEVSRSIMQMQIALDKFNQTEEFEVEL